MNALLKKIKRLYALPKPTTLGFSSDYAMGSRDFGLQPGQECWEDYYEICEKKYPIRYFIKEKLGAKIYRWKSQLSDLRYEFLYLFHPKYRYHQLSLAQPFGYQRGWIDADTQILFANFNLLVNYVEGELGGFSELEKQLEYYLDPWGENGHTWTEHAKVTKELIELYSYWKWERLPYYQYNYPYPSQKLSFDEKEEDMEKETEMLVRLMKVRRSMWT